MKNIKIYQENTGIIWHHFWHPFINSCNDWLDVEPDDELVKERFWQKTSDVDGALAATYNAMRNASLQSLILGECRADLMFSNGPDLTNYAQIAASNISPTNGAVNWRHYYSAINLANTLMHFNKEVFEKDNTFTQKMLDGVDAEALFIRSLAYFYLVRLWKDVPLVLEPSISDTTNLYIGKSSEKEIINQIISDLLKAKDMAYTTEFHGTDYFYGRANKYSIMALLADVYLWDEQYQKC
jgi:starch-binding outer membrane protein, SusD/RagB family